MIIFILIPNTQIGFFNFCFNVYCLGPTNDSKLRSIFYPPITDDLLKAFEGRKGQIVRCGEHSDYGTITFLYQDDMGGLEVRAVDNSWIKVISSF